MKTATMAFGLAFALSAAAPVDAGTVDLRISDGRVWLVATGVTVAEILDEWTRIGGTEIVDADRVPGSPLTLVLTDVSEQEALDLLLRAAGGYLGVHAAAKSAKASRFDRLFILPTTGRMAAAGQDPSDAPPASPPPTAPPVFAGGGQRLIGPDGQPVPDDQEDAPPPRPLLAPEFPTVEPGTSPPRAAPDSRVPTTPAGVPTPGMVVPAPQPAEPSNGEIPPAR
jgi:hypothetical protein